MLTKANLEALAEQRLQDAHLLLREDRASSAYYLAGYALEFALKACIARAFRAEEIPDKAFVLDVHTHDLRRLLVAAGLKDRFDADGDRDPSLAGAWALACRWNERSRYVAWDTAAARKLITAIADPNSGVLPWLKSHWSKARSSRPSSS